VDSSGARIKKARLPDLARHPWVRDFRLLDVVGLIPPIPETAEKTSEVVIRHYYRQLGRAKFTAVKVVVV
jgi:hypothetical protein